MAHYNSFVRIPALIVRQAIAPLAPIPTLATDTIKMRVWPNDIDFNLHLNNARYLSVMDYGRIRLLARTGLLRPVLKARYAPVVGSVWITYRRSLPLWARFQLSTRVACWDERWFYMEQTFTGDEGLAAAGWVKGALLDKSGIVPPQQIVDLAHGGVQSPPLPEAIQTLNSLTRDKLQGTGSSKSVQ
jgi:acyl-CoA thioesterase FadM